MRISYNNKHQRRQYYHQAVTPALLQQPLISLPQPSTTTTTTATRIAALAAVTATRTTVTTATAAMLNV